MNDVPGKLMMTVIGFVARSLKSRGGITMQVDGTMADHQTMAVYTV